MPVRIQKKCAEFVKYFIPTCIQAALLRQDKQMQRKMNVARAVLGQYSFSSKN